MTDYIVAIDGPAGSGKSSVSRDVAQKLAWIMLDTGAMYRAITWAVLEAGIDPDDSNGVADIADRANVVITTRPDQASITVDSVDVTTAIRSPEVTEAVSAVSAVKQVRERLVDIQRSTVASSQHGVVIEGRDIGTVVLPHAPLKIYLTADPRVRALRRSTELGAALTESDIEAMEKALTERDSKDSSRELSPLKAAPDALVIDTTDMTQQEVVSLIIARAREVYSLP